MELQKTIEKRTSVRSFKDIPVPVEDLRHLARMGGYAPSVNNYQPWKFYAITNRNLLGRMAEKVKAKIEEIPENESIASKNIKNQVEFFSTFFEDAPAVIALSMEDYESVLEKGVTMSHQDINILRNYPDIQSAGAAIENILLTAVDMGYGACWLSAPMMAKEALEELIGIGEPFHLTAFVAVGVPATDIRPKERKPLEEIFELID
ncbi:MAG: nitroreductase family protein [Bacteroidales bacterium]